MVCKWRYAAILLTAALLAPGTSSFASTPTPKPHALVKKLVTKKPVPLAAKKSGTAKLSATKPGTKKIIGKKVTKVISPNKTTKTVIHHYYYRPRPRIGVPPAPAPHWPPTGFVSASGVYARIPTGQELVSILSTSKDPSASVNECAPDPNNPSLQAVACGAILAASQNGCSWWEVNSTLNGPDPSNPANIIALGSLRTLSAGTAAHSVSTIILVSGVPLGNAMKFTSITAKCWLTQTDETVPSDTFTPAPGVDISLAPTPTPTPSTSQSGSTSSALPSIEPSATPAPANSSTSNTSNTSN